MPLVCKIELDKNNGITVEIDNDDGKITQTLTMDGTQITLSVAKEGQDPCTIVQTADAVTITCKQFTVNASETITCKSTKASEYTSADALTINSTKDMTLDSKAKLVAQATSDLEGSGANLKLSASTGSASMAASAAEAKVSGMTLKLAGSTSAELSAASAKVSATGQLDLESTGLATLKGSLTNVQGNLVNLG